MSLLPSISAVSPGTIPYVASVSASGADPIIATTAGQVKINPRADGQAFFNTAGPAGRSLTLGANNDTYANIVLTDGAITMNKPANMMNGGYVPAGQTLSVAGALSATGGITTDDSININGSLMPFANISYYVQAFNAIPDGSNNVSLGTASPSLGGGLYFVLLQVTGVPKQGLSFCGYWDGAKWSAGASATATNYPGGGQVVGLNADTTTGATLLISNATGGDISGYVYYVPFGIFHP